MTIGSRLRSMAPRDTEEAHRASTPLELLFDLCFVVAVSQAASQLNHGISDGHIRATIVGYLMVFFAIWWAWVNFTWFASAYDIDDIPYRLLTLIQIAGVLILAAGVSSAFGSGDYTTITIGYVVMRVGLVAQWLRAAASDREGRTVALRYALGITLCQVGWVVRLVLPRSWADASFCVLALAEMAVPLWAERGDRLTSWHPGHITERYGLFTLIVMGESVAAATVAIKTAVGSGHLSASLIGVAGGGLLLVFGQWWWYFDHSAEEGLRLTPRMAYPWGYGHYAVFAAVAAFGAGLEVSVTAVSQPGGPSTVTASLAVAAPVAIYLVVTAVLLARISPRWTIRPWSIPGAAAALIGLAFTAHWWSLGLVLPLMGAVVAVLITLDLAMNPNDGRV